MENFATSQLIQKSQFIGDITFKTEILWIKHSASGIIFCFTGTSIVINFIANIVDNYCVYLKVIIKNQNRIIKNFQIKIQSNGKQLYIANLDSTIIHEITIIKKTEFKYGICGIKSVQCNGTIIKKTNGNCNYFVEYIGDSITCGNSNVIGSIFFPFSLVWEDALRSYATFFSAKLQANFSIIAYSGIGVLNSQQNVGKMIISDFYNKILNERQFLKKRDLIIINIGTNDSKFLNQSNFIDFENAYEKFILQLRKIYPFSIIICTVGPMKTRAISLIQKVCNNLREEDGKLFFYCFKEINILKEGIGKGGHPSVFTHKRMAKELYQFCLKECLWMDSISE